jgi:hypothetical protein
LKGIAFCEPRHYNTCQANPDEAMNTTIAFILLALILLACALRRSSRIEPVWSQHRKGGQKVFTLAAVIMAILIVMNPEFLALGILGDTAFFDMLVLALSLQMHMVVVRVFHSCLDVLRRTLRWLGIPSLGLRYLLAVLTPIVSSAVSTFRQGLHRFFRGHEQTAA